MRSLDIDMASPREGAGLADDTTDTHAMPIYRITTPLLSPAVDERRNLSTRWSR